MTETISHTQEKARKASVMARLMKTVSHPTRLAIIDLLADKGPMKVKDIIDVVGVSQSNGSQHLKALEMVGVLDSERDGKCMTYFVRKTQIRHLLDCVSQCVDC